MYKIEDLIEDQKEIIEELGVKPKIYPLVEIERRKTFLREYLEDTEMEGYVLGLSGGQDSTLAGKLTQMACDEYDKTFIAVKLPYGEQKDADDVDLAIKFIKPTKVLTVDIKPIVDTIVQVYEQSTGKPLADYHKGNVKARIRMVMQYAIAGANKMLVIGTDHAAENLMGFFTKFGDGAADILPLSGLTKFQGREMLKALECPERLYLKTPTADLLDNNPGRPDEDELGITYDIIEKFLIGQTMTEDQYIKVLEQFEKTEHKRHLPVVY
jgi:NAD+ synthase